MCTQKHTAGCHTSSVWTGPQYHRSDCTCSTGSRDSSLHPHVGGWEPYWHIVPLCTTIKETSYFTTVLKSEIWEHCTSFEKRFCVWKKRRNDERNILLISEDLTLSVPHSVPSRGRSSFVLHEGSPSTKHHRPAHIRCWKTIRDRGDSGDVVLEPGESQIGRHCFRFIFISFSMSFF